MISSAEAFFTAGWGEFVFTSTADAVNAALTPKISRYFFICLLPAYFALMRNTLSM